MTKSAAPETRTHDPYSDHLGRLPAAPAVLPRRPTEAEWLDLVADFPLLTRDDVWITGEATPRYNCIAWTLGYTDRWINPPQPKASFERLYTDHGYAVVPARAVDALIDGWGTQPGPHMTHGSRRYAGQAGLFESKLGSDVRISHNRYGLVSGLYGDVVTSFNDPPLAALAPKGGPAVKSLSPDELSALQQRHSGVAPQLRQEFAQAYEHWRKTWRRLTDDTRDLATGPEFERLARLGEAILPLVVEKMIQPDGFPALVLYDRLATDPTLVVRYTEDDPHVAEGEQARALRSARLFLNQKS